MRGSPGGARGENRHQAKTSPLASPKGGRFRLRAQATSPPNWFVRGELQVRHHHHKRPSGARVILPPSSPNLPTARPVDFGMRELQPLIMHQTSDKAASGIEHNEIVLTLIRLFRQVRHPVLVRLLTSLALCRVGATMRLGSVVEGSGIRPCIGWYGE